MPFWSIIEGGSLQRFQALNSAEPKLSKIENLLVMRLHMYQLEMLDLYAWLDLILNMLFG